MVYASKNLPVRQTAERSAAQRLAARPNEARFASPQAARQWRNIGPKPTSSYFPGNWGLTSGRINAIAVSPADPNLILIGAATGGVWRSTDGGATFNAVSDNHVDLAVGSIAFAPSNPSIVYAGMGDKAQAYLGSGVLKSTDGGQTWTRISNSTLPSPGRISQILVDPSDANRVSVAQLAFTESGVGFPSGFYYSTDGGVNWTKTFSGLTRDLVRHPTEPNTLFLATQSFAQTTTAGVWKSTNNGLNWTQIYTSPFAFPSNIKIAVTTAAVDNLYVLVGDSTAARLEVSTNGGGTWTNKGSAFDKGQFGYNCYLFVNPANPDIIYVGTRDLWVSTDGGTTYTNYTKNFTIAGGYTPTQSKSHPDQHHFYISQSNPNLIYIANDGGLWKSTDGANSFQSLNASLTLTMFVSLDMHPTDPTKTYGGTQDNGTQKRTGNVDWREFGTGDGGQTFVDPLDPSIVYITYVGNTIYRYGNNGDNFSATIGTNAVFQNDRVAFYPPFVGNEVDSNLYFGTYRLHISETRGASWTRPAGTFDLTFGGIDVLSAIGVSRSNTNVIYTGSAQGRAMVSINEGVSWTDITNGLPLRFIKSIIVSPTDPNTAYLTVSGFGSGHVFKTVNAGASWTDISGDLPNIPTNTLLIDPNNPSVLYVGTDIGVFRSTVGGNTWETFNMGLPPTIVTELDSQTSGLIQASTYGRGAYELTSVRVPWVDFDGDGKTDISIFRPSVGEWWYLRSSDGQIPRVSVRHVFGQNRARRFHRRRQNRHCLLASFNRRMVYLAKRRSKLSTRSRSEQTAIFPRPAILTATAKPTPPFFVLRTATWFILRSSGGTTIQQFGANGDVPVVADYDGDGKSDIAIYRPISRANGGFYERQSDVIAFQIRQQHGQTRSGRLHGRRQSGRRCLATFRR